MTGESRRRRTVTTAEIEARVEELRAEIAGLEADGAPCNEPTIRTLRARLAELEALLAGDPDWRRRVRERRIRGAAGDYMRKKGGR